MSKDAESCQTGPSLEALRARYTELVEGILAVNAEVETRITQLEERERYWDNLMCEVAKNGAATKSKIDLNVGGRTFTTSKGTLLKYESTYFHALLSSGKWEPCEDGSYFIDRDPGLFDRVMESLRSGESVNIEGLQERQLSKLQVELDYYQLPGELCLPLANARPVARPARWDISRCSNSLKVSEEGRAVTKTEVGGGYCACVAAEPDVPSFRVRIWNRGSEGDIAVGYARSAGFTPDGANHNRSGWFVYISSGDLWSGFGDRGRSYCAPLNQGDLLEVQYDKTSGLISFAVNGAGLGVAFTSTNSYDGPLFPCVDMYEPGASVALED